MDKAADFDKATDLGSEDCGFESHHGLYADLCEYKSLHLHMNQYILKSNLKSSGQGQGMKLYRMMSHHSL